jgi:hypothetical protein
LWRVVLSAAPTDEMERTVIFGGAFSFVVAESGCAAKNGGICGKIWGAVGV